MMEESGKQELFLLCDKPIFGDTVGFIYPENQEFIFERGERVLC